MHELEEAAGRKTDFAPNKRAMNFVLYFHILVTENSIATEYVSLSLH